MATQFMTTSIYDQLVALLLKNSGSLSMQIGGLASPSNWTAAFPNKGQGNNLDIQPNTTNTVRVKAGTIWTTGLVALTLPSDVLVGFGQTITFTNLAHNHLYAVNSGGTLVVQNVAGNSPTPPLNSVGEIGVVYVGSSGLVMQITTIPKLINQLYTSVATVSFVNWLRQVPPTIIGSNPDNAIQVVAAFNIVGSVNIGEFAVSSGVAGLANTDVVGGSTVLAYFAQDVQTTYIDSLLTVTWNLMVNKPPTFYP